MNCTPIAEIQQKVKDMDYNNPAELHNQLIEIVDYIAVIKDQLTNIVQVYNRSIHHNLVVK